MARTIGQIQAAIIASVAANNNLTYQDADNITQNITNNTSKRAIWLAWTWIWAAAIAVLEQLQDVYIAQIETLVSQSAAASPLWIQAKMFAFQYSASNPQIVQLINTVPQYPVTDTTLLIITACSVTVDLTNTVNIKVATGNPLVPLNELQLQAAQSYINLIGDAGINYSVQSATADRLYISADIYFNGQYSSSISNNTIAAITNWLVTLSQTNFNGSIKMSDLENVFRQVPGNNDVVLKIVSFRPATTDGLISLPTVTPLSVTSPLINNSQILNRIYSPIAGYIVPEYVSGYGFTDPNPADNNISNLNFIAQ